MSCRIIGHYWAQGILTGVGLSAALVTLVSLNRSSPTSGTTDPILPIGYGQNECKAAAGDQEIEESEHLSFSEILERTRNDRFVPLQAITGLTKEHPKGVTNLIQAFVDASYKVRVLAAYAVGALATEHIVDLRETIPGLIRLLDDPVAEVRFWAVHALSYMNATSDAALPGLIRLLGDSDRGSDGKHVFVRGSAARVLGKLGPEAQAAIPELTRLLEDQDPFTRDEATRALAKIAAGTNIEAPSKMLTDATHPGS